MTASSGTPVRSSSEFCDGVPDPLSSDDATDSSYEYGAVADSVIVMVLLLVRSAIVYLDT